MSAISEIVLIAAVDRNMGIGIRGSKKIPWMGKLKADMRHFGKTTQGHPVIMGRYTRETLSPLPKLPHRPNIVLTSNPEKYEDLPRLWHTSNQDEALKIAARESSSGTAFVMGGEEIYNLFFRLADKLIITHIHAEFPECNAHFPEIDETLWQPTELQRHTADAENAYDFEIVTYIRKREQ